MNGHLGGVSPSARYHQSALCLPSVLNPVRSPAAVLRRVASDESTLCICPTLEAEAQFWGPTAAVPG